MDQWQYNKYLFQKYQRLLLIIANNRFGRSLLKIPAYRGNNIQAVFPNGIKYSLKNETFFDIYIDQRLAKKVRVVLELFEIFSFVSYIKTIRYFGIISSFLFLINTPFHYLFPLLISSIDLNSHSTGSGNLNSGSQATWAAARGLATASTESTDLVVYTWRVNASSWFILRAFLPFDTSSIPNDIKVNSMVLKIYHADAGDFFNEDSVILHVVPSTQNDSTDLVVADMDALSFTSKGSLAYSSIVVDSYNDITVNLDQLNLSGYTKLALIDSNDLNNSAPTGRNTLDINDVGSSEPPILSISVGYTMGDEISLPSNDTDLETEYDMNDIGNVATADDTRVTQTGTNQYIIHQFKNDIGGASACNVTWEGQTTWPPSSNPVTLQIYNRNTTSWETIDSDNTTAEDTDFQLSASIADTTDYVDGDGYISCRVYQLASF